MARNYGRFTTSVWLDGDFTGLTPTQQAVYFMLATQPNVTAAGTLELTLRRWASLADGMTPETLRDELKQLESSTGHHVVVDEDTEELLIRKFVKFDGGIGNEKRRPVIREAALGIRSTRIRHALAIEIGNLGHADMASELAPDRASGRPVIHSENGQADSPSDVQSGFDRVVVNEGDHIPNPQPATLEGAPQPDTASADASAGPPSMTCSKHPDGTEDACGPCGSARKRYAAWAQSKLERDLEAKRRAVEARAACTACDDRGMRLDPNSRQPLGRCDHGATS